jgi:hypothetical protein
MRTRRRVEGKKVYVEKKATDITLIICSLSEKLL